MAEYGVELINDKNYVVQNASDVNFALRASGTLKNADFKHSIDDGVGFFSPGGKFAVLDVSSFNCPIVFLRPLNSASRVATVPITNSSDFLLPGNALKKHIAVYAWKQTLSDIEYFIFDRWTPGERSSYGMQVFNASGGIIFDSGWNFLTLKSVIWMNAGYPNHAGDSSGTNYTVIGSVPATKLAVAMPYSRFYTVAGMASGGVLVECFHIAGNNITISLVPRGAYFWTPPNDGFFQYGMKSQVMCAEVSKMPQNYNPVKIL